MAHCNGPASVDFDRAKQAHVLVWRSRIPVNEGDCQVFFCGRKDFDGENVWPANSSSVGDVEFVGTPCAGDVIGICDLLSVQKNISAVVDAAEIQPNGFAFIGWGENELLAEPPRHHEGAVLL